MVLDNFIKGLNILRPYFDKYDGGYNLGAEHDIIYIYPTDRPLSLSDIKSLKELDWFQENIDSDNTEEVAYDPLEGWCVYT